MVDAKNEADSMLQHRKMMSDWAKRFRGGKVRSRKRLKSQQRAWRGKPVEIKQTSGNTYKKPP
jgi:hypothetical protein